MGKKSNYLFFVTLVATLGGLLFGYDTAVISGTVKYLGINFIDPRGLSETAANALSGFLVSSALIGCILGGLCGGFMAQKLGRKRSLIVASVLFTVAALGSAFPELGFAKDETYKFLGQFVFYRIIGGMGIGLASMLSPMYIAEMAPAEKRGSLVSWNQFAVVFGILVVYFVNYFIAKSGDEAWLAQTGWRMMFLSGVIPALLLFILVLFIPESPRWLVMKGREGEAGEIIAKVNRKSNPAIEIAGIKDSLQGVVKARLFTYGVAIVVIGVVLSFFQQAVGINVVLYYAPEIFRSMNMGTDAAMFQTILVGVINMVFTVIAIFTVDKFGRKPLMLVGSAGMAVSMACLGMVLCFGGAGVLALLSMLCFIASFAMSWGPVAWVLLAEIFPNKIRGHAMSIAVATMWISNYLVSWTFPMMDKSSYLNAMFHHGFAYWVYALIALLSLLFVWRFIPETKGKTLEEMDNLLKSRR